MFCKIATTPSYNNKNSLTYSFVDAFMLGTCSLINIFNKLVIYTSEKYLEYLAVNNITYCCVEGL